MNILVEIGQKLRKIKSNLNNIIIVYIKNLDLKCML
jgi:hypothetical protein